MINYTNYNKTNNKTNGNAEGCPASNLYVLEI